MKQKVIRSAFFLLSVSAVFFVTLNASGQQKPLKIALTNASTIASADIVKDMSKQCPNVTVTLDSSKADYMLEASGEGHAGNGEYLKYKFTLFDRDGDALYSTSTHHLSNAVKDVCNFIKTKN